MGKIVETYGWVHLRAGDLLGAERKDPSSKHGELINEHIREGKIVPVEITLALIRKAMEASQTTDFLVDGFPRSADNLKGWEDNMTTCTDVVSLLYLETSEQVWRSASCSGRGRPSRRAARRAPTTTRRRSRSGSKRTTRPR